MLSVSWFGAASSETPSETPIGAESSLRPRFTGSGKGVGGRVGVGLQRFGEMKKKRDRARCNKHAKIGASVLVRKIVSKGAHDGRRVGGFVTGGPAHESCTPYTKPEFV